MKVFWTATAEAHLDALFLYISCDSKEYARRVVDRITRRSIQIGDCPFSGRMVPELSVDRIREVLEGSYRIIYYIKSDQIDVLAVVHGAQRFPWREFQR